jgi:RND family efflux transporter MFP subunit
MRAILNRVGLENNAYARPVDGLCFKKVGSRSGAQVRVSQRELIYRDKALKQRACEKSGGEGHMSIPESLASLTINRGASRKRRKVWPWALGAALLAGAFVAPQMLSHFQQVEISVVPVVKITGALATGRGGSGDLSAAGYVVADRKSVLASKATGRLIRLLVAESQFVKEGELVAEIDHVELDALIASVAAEEAESAREAERLEQAVKQTQAELNAAKAPLATLDAEIEELKIKLADAKRKLERDRKVALQDAMPASIIADREYEVMGIDAGIVTAHKRRAEILQRVAVAEAQIAVAESAVKGARARGESVLSRKKVLEAQRRDSFVHAPFDGVVTEKAAEVGEIVAPISVGGMMARGSVATLADWKSRQAEVDVAEAYISRVKAGGRAAITVDALPGKGFPGRVLRILPRANRSKATVQVRIEFLQTEDGILPDMGVRVKFLPDDAPAGTEQAAGKTRLALPKAAVQGATGAEHVWVVADNQARKKSIAVGETAGDNVEIKTGLAEGEKVVLRGAELLREDGQKVRIVE